MGSVAVVVPDILVDYGFEMTSANDQHVVEAPPVDRTDEVLTEGISTRGPNRSPDDPDALGAKDLVEAVRELGVSIPDQESDRMRSVGKSMDRFLACWITHAAVG